MLVHEAHKLLAAAVLDVKAVGDVLDAGHQFHRRVVAVNPRQRDVGQQVVATDRGAENALHQMIEDAVVIVFLLDQREMFLLAGDGAMNRVAQRRGGELFAAQIFLRAAEHRLGQVGRVLAGADHQHRQPRRLRGERGDLKQGGGIRLRHLEEERVEIVGGHHRQAGVRRRLDGDVHRRQRRAHQFTDAAGGIRVAAHQQNFAGIMFHVVADSGKIQFPPPPASVMRAGRENLVLPNEGDSV